VVWCEDCLSPSLSVTTSDGFDLTGFFKPGVPSFFLGLGENMYVLDIQYLELNDKAKRTVNVDNIQ